MRCDVELTAGILWLVGQGAQRHARKNIKISRQRAHNANIKDSLGGKKEFLSSHCHIIYGRLTSHTWQFTDGMSSVGHTSPDVRFWASGGTQPLDVATLSKFGEVLSGMAACHSDKIKPLKDDMDLPSNVTLTPRSGLFRPKRE